MKLKFQLTGEHSALRVALPGGSEIAIDGAAVYQTDDPAEIAVLDAHPAAKRAPKTKPKPKTAAPGAAGVGAEEDPAE